MAGDVREFGGLASGLARSPLGIIALFIVLVYGLASLVTIFSHSMSFWERAPIIYFLVLFPVMVLTVFAWLVSHHSDKLFAPSDFKNEDNYVKVRLSVVHPADTVARKSDSIRTFWRSSASNKRTVEKWIENNTSYGSVAIFLRSNSAELYSKIITDLSISTS